MHLLAIAHAAKVKLTIDDFTRIGKRVPVLADGRFSGGGHGLRRRHDCAREERRSHHH